MVRRTPAARTPAVDFPPQVVAALRAELPVVADRVISTVIAEVPSYTKAWDGPMGETIRSAVQLALAGFLNLATRKQSGAGAQPVPALEGAYALGRGEARSGRSMEALLAAYRIGARTAWRDMARVAVEAGLEAEQMSTFAELVFAYIDEVSASSVAGHTDELESSGRLRRRNLERLCKALLTDTPADAVVAAAERADWDPPATLTAVLLPDAQVGSVLSLVDSRTLDPEEEPAGLAEGSALLLVAQTARGSRAQLLRVLAATDAVVGPTVPWLDAAASYQRALRCQGLPRSSAGVIDSDHRLAELVLGADPLARSDLRSRVLAPLADLRPATAEKLTDTLRAWLVHHGRREDIAAALFVHPQTVRYRVGQLREVYGDRLDDPAFVLDATIALA